MVDLDDEAVALSASGNAATADIAARSHQSDSTQTEPGVFSVDEAIDVAELLMHPADSTAAGAGNVVPDSPQAARLAVEHLNKKLRDLPSVIRQGLTGAERNADRLSDDKLQGLAELIQNADDVGASRVAFALNPAVPIVAARPERPEAVLTAEHDGAPLRLRDVVAMGVPWLSMKGDDPSKVGQFGIGLMTLRSLSDTLDVHCGHFHLRFRAGNMTYLTDTNCYPALADSRTIFCVPVDEGQLGTDELYAWLTQWGDAGLLFLPHVREIDLLVPQDRGGGHDGHDDSSRVLIHLAIEREPSIALSSSLNARTNADAGTGSHVGATTRTVVREHGGAQWAVYAHDITTPQVERRSDKPARATTRVAVAFLLTPAANEPAADDLAGDHRVAGHPASPPHFRSPHTGGPATSVAASATVETGPHASVAPQARHQDVPGGVIHVGLPVRRIGLTFRMSAAFEPLANRRDLLDATWNRALLACISDLWCRASLDTFSRSPADGWRTIPLSSEFEAARPLPGRLGQVLADELLAAARTRLAEALTFPAADGALTGFAQMAVEHPDLTDIVDAADVAELTAGRVLLPAVCRDRAGRWRAVLDELEKLQAPTPARLGVADALQLLTNPDRDARLMSALTGVALQHDLASALNKLWCVATTDGARRPEQLKLVPMLIDDSADPTWTTLGLGITVDPDYANDTAWKPISAWLTEQHCFATSATQSLAVLRLSKSGKSGQVLPGALTDTQAQALRAAVEALEEEQRVTLGPGIGLAVSFDAVTYDARGRRQQVTARPCEAYIIERDPDSWSIAAGHTRGLTWLHRRYGDSLRSPAGRAGGVGAQKLFRLLGAESAPRVMSNPRAELKYQGQSRAVPLNALNPLAQAAMRGLDADYVIGDTISPHLDAVLANISAEKSAAERRRRANAVIASLSRAWERLPTEAQAVKAYYGWNAQGQVSPTWLLNTRKVAWLSSSSGARRQASELAIKTPGNIAMLGSEPSAYLHPVHDRSGWREVLLALGVRGDPAASDLINELKQLRTQTLTDRTLDQAAAVEAASPLYEALAENAESGSTAGVGDVPHRALITIFNSGIGLIATEHGWRRPNQVWAGPAIFGNLRTFVPAITNGDRLWRALEIRRPRATDAVEVIRDLAKTKQLTSEDRLVEINALRMLVSAHTVAAGNRLRLTTSTPPDLRKLPVWTGSAWVRDRPVFAVTDLRLVDVLSGHVRVWQPGAELHQFEALIKPLRLTPVAPSNMVILAEDSVIDEDSTTTFQAAVTLLQADLALNDPSVEQALSISWHELAAFEVSVCSDLRVRPGVEVLRSVPPLSVHAWVSPKDQLLYVSDPSQAGQMEHGGLALAALFAATNPRLVALPWLAAWNKAEVGVREQALVIASRREAEMAAQRTRESQQRLDDLRGPKGKRSKTTSNGKPAGGGGAPTAPSGATPPPPSPSQPEPPRILVDPRQFRVDDIAGTLLPGTGAKSAAPRPPTPSKPLIPPRPPSGNPPTSRRGAVSYTAREREDVGMRLVREVLGGEASGILDIRDQRGVGADAVDELEKFYELKVHAGPIPDQIRLTDSEVQKALSTPDYFLVLVGNVEDGVGAPEVRIINDPLAHLTPTRNGHITLAGAQSAQALRFSFSAVPDPAGSSEDVDDASPTGPADPT